MQACIGPDDDNAVENVFWPTGEAPGGAYSVWVEVYETCDAPLDWQLSVRRNGTLVVDQSGNGDSAVYSFTLGQAGEVSGASRAVDPRHRHHEPKPSN